MTCTEITNQLIITFRTALKLLSLILKTKKYILFSLLKYLKKKVATKYFSKIVRNIKCLKGTVNLLLKVFQ